MKNVLQFIGGMAVILLIGVLLSFMFNSGDKERQAAYLEGYDEGYEDGREAGKEYGIENGYDSGYSEGYECGYEAGSENGYSDGYSDGLYDGRREGYDDGYLDGYEIGEVNGRDDALAGLYEDGHGALIEDTERIRSEVLRDQDVRIAQMHIPNPVNPGFEFQSMAELEDYARQLHAAAGG